jgi:hypothetical protein
MIFERAQGKISVASLVERKTRFAVLFRNNDRSSTHFVNKLMDVMEPLPQTHACPGQNSLQIIKRKTDLRAHVSGMLRAALPVHRRLPHTNHLARRGGRSCGISLRCRMKVTLFIPTWAGAAGYSLIRALCR